MVIERHLRSTRRRRYMCGTNCIACLRTAHVNARSMSSKLSPSITNVNFPGRARGDEHSVTDTSALGQTGTACSKHLRERTTLLFWTNGSLVRPSKLVPFLHLMLALHGCAERNDDHDVLEPKTRKNQTSLICTVHTSCQHCRSSSVYLHRDRSLEWIRL
jgi:hypothetical protein